MALRYDVFISYRRDHGSSLAVSIELLLENNGIHACLDVRQHELGDVWRREIVANITDSKLFLILLTENSLERMAVSGDVSLFELETAFELGVRVIPVAVSEAVFKTHEISDRPPAAVSRLLGLHCLTWSHKALVASERTLLDALNAASRHRRTKATAEFENFDRVAKQLEFQKWQAAWLDERYRSEAKRTGVVDSELYCPVVRGIRYPVVCFESAIGGERFVHRLLLSKLETRELRKLPNLVLDPRAPLPDWVRAVPQRQRYFELLALAMRVRRWNMPGFAMSSLRLDTYGRVEGFDAQLCTYGENCLTSHLLGFDLLRSWQDGRPGELKVPRPNFGAVLRPGEADFLPLISVQAIVAYRDDDGTWRAITMERAGNLAAASGFWQFPPAGGFEIFGTEGDDGDYVRQQFDIRMALLREFLEEIFGDVEMACEASQTSGSEQEGAEGYRKLVKALSAGKLSIHFLGVVTELVSMRPEFSFIIVIDDIEYFRDLRYSHTIPGGEVVKAQWLMARSETKRLNRSVLGDLDGLLSADKNWHMSSVGMLVLLSRETRKENGWLRAKYTDFPELILS